MSARPFTEAAPPGPVVDFDSALAGMGGDEDGLKAVCQVFLDEAPKTLAQLASAGAAARDEMLALLHEVANSLAVVGAFGSARTVREWEMSLRADDSKPAGPALQLAERSLRQASEDLRKYLGAAGGSA